MSTADPTLQKQRDIQQQQDQKDSAAGQASRSRYRVVAQCRAAPVPSPVELPAQHLDKPAQASDLALQQRFMAPDCKGSGKLQGFATLIRGAGSGIGRAVAVLFAREGADVAVSCHSSDGDAQETQRYIEAEGRRCLLLKGDGKDTAWRNHAVQFTVSTFGKLDVLVNNALFQEHAAQLEDITDERMSETLDTNLGGYLCMARAALRHMKQPRAAACGAHNELGHDAANRTQHQASRLTGQPVRWNRGLRSAPSANCPGRPVPGGRGRMDAARA